MEQVQPAGGGPPGPPRRAPLVLGAAQVIQVALHPVLPPFHAGEGVFHLLLAGLHLLLVGLHLLLVGFHPVLPGFHPVLSGFHPVLSGFHLVLPGFHPGLPGLQLLLSGLQLLLSGLQAVKPRVGGKHILVDNLRQVGHGFPQLPDGGRQLPELLVQDIATHRLPELRVLLQYPQDVLE